MATCKGGYAVKSEGCRCGPICASSTEGFLGGSQHPLPLGGAAGAQLPGTLQSTLLHNQMPSNFSPSLTRESRLWSRLCSTPVLVLRQESKLPFPIAALSADSPFYCLFKQLQFFFFQRGSPFPLLWPISWLTSCNPHHAM